MTYEILKVNAIQRRDFRGKKYYDCIAVLCEDKNNTSGLVYLLDDVLRFYETHDTCPGTIEQATPTSLADAVDGIYTHYQGVLLIVEARFPPETPASIKQNYLLYELWAIKPHAALITADLLQTEHVGNSK